MKTEGLIKGLTDLYCTYGYRNFRMSKFEKYELYAGYKDFLVSDRVITFNDTNGELLALKPDVTLSIVRSADYHPGQKQKLFYSESVYRPSGSERRFQEISQCGLECLGDLDAYDVYEVLHLAGESLRRISEKSILSVSHLGIVRCLMTALQADEEAQRSILQLIAARNLHELAELFRLRNWSMEILSNVDTLLSLSCSIKDLPERLRVAAFPWLLEDILFQLDTLSALLYDGEDEMIFDFSVINDIHYYNGVVFQGFVQGVSEKVLAGGRYDSLLERMKQKGGAIGFAIYSGLLEQLRSPAEKQDGGVLVLYDSSTPLTLVRDTVLRLQAEGRPVSAQRSAEGLYQMTIDLRGRKP